MIDPLTLVVRRMKLCHSTARRAVIALYLGKLAEARLPKAAKQYDVDMKGFDEKMCGCTQVVVNREVVVGKYIYR